MAITYEIRRAHASSVEAAAIHQVEHASVGDSSYAPALILQLLRNRAHYPYLAWVDDTPVGFCWCLETSLATGKRLEIDLLGVLPAFRRHGIATALIQQATTDAFKRGIKSFRGIVAKDNLASQHAFAKAGLRTASEPSELLVYRLSNRTPTLTLPGTFSWRIVPEIDCTATTRGVHDAFSVELSTGSRQIAIAECLFVETLVYRGVWIEQLRGVEEDILLLVRGLVVWCAQQALDELGILCSRDALTQSGQYEALWRAGLESWGYFYIFGKEITGLPV